MTDQSSDISTIDVGSKKIILVGTAHVSNKSAELVEQVINSETPDAVCIELDDKRLDALKDSERWRKLNLLQIIKKRQFMTFIVSLIGSAWQKKLGEKTGALPGSEFLKAVEVSEDKGIPISLCDRDMAVTLKRAWRLLPFRKKMMLFAALFQSVFDKEELDVTEDQLEELRKQDVIKTMIEQWGQWLPSIKTTLLDERDIWMAEKIKATTGDKLVAVVGAAHVAGITKRLQEDNHDQLPLLQVIPPASQWWKIVGWGFPLLIVLSIILIGITQGVGEAQENIWYWIFANGIPCSLGAMIAMAHPVTVVTAFLSAPITSLTPVIGAAYVTAFVQAWLRPPIVEEFHRLSEDFVSLKGWWRNRVLKIFLAFILPGLGSAVGSVVGGTKIITDVMQGF